MPYIFVKNLSNAAVDCFVSKYTGEGQDDWFTINSSSGDSWNRKDGWELVAFRVGDKRKGVYIKTGSYVKFHGLDRIDVE